MRYVEGRGSGIKRANEQFVEKKIQPVLMEVSNGDIRVNIVRKAGKVRALYRKSVFGEENCRLKQ